MFMAATGKKLRPTFFAMVTVILLGELGKTYGVNWVKQTHSCSTTTGSEPCLDYYECESCYERRYAFEEVGMKDPFYKGGDY